ncbi:hypothetical protein BY996DRAFT_6501035 [Phakopsora pachyrhizi]|nr:hypothetical protein BY996DRAFT_6501035 [Phakopsora pachyrhizi]
MTTIAQHFDRMIQDAELHAFSSLTAAVNEDSDSEIDECDFHPAGRDADNEGDGKKT